MAVTNDEEFRAWLEGQNEHVCTSVAFRAAMRALPRAISTNDSKLEEERALTVFRCALTAGVGARIPTREVVDAAFAADKWATPISDIYIAARASSLAAACAAASRSTASAAAFSHAAVHCANHALGFWSYGDTELDLDQLAVSRISIPKDFRGELDVGSLLQAEMPWAFWVKWYDAAMRGEPLDWNLQEQVALIPDEVWEAGPEAATSAIEKLEFQFRTKVSPSLVRDEDANVFRIEDDPDVPRDVAGFATHRAGQALSATLASVSDNVFNEGSYEALVIRETLDGPKTMSLLATGLYDSCLGLDANIGDRYPEEVALINLKNALAGIVDELCELDDAARQRCAQRAGYAVPSVEKALTKEELQSIPEITRDELDDPAREVIESEVERILVDEAAMPRWRRIRLANWMTTISIYWDRTKKGFKEAETLAKMVSKLRNAWRNLDGDGG